MRAFDTFFVTFIKNIMAIFPSELETMKESFSLEFIIVYFLKVLYNEI